MCKAELRVITLFFATFPTSKGILFSRSWICQNRIAANGAVMDTTWHYKPTISYCTGYAGTDGVASCTKNVGRATIG